MHLVPSLEYGGLLCGDGPGTPTPSKAISLDGRYLAKIKDFGSEQNTIELFEKNQWIKPLAEALLSKPKQSALPKES